MVIRSLVTGWLVLLCQKLHVIIRAGTYRPIFIKHPCGGFRPPEVFYGTSMHRKDLATIDLNGKMQ